MRNRKYILKIFTALFVISFILLSLSIIVLFINIEQNKGIVPFIFIFSFMFYFFSNYEYLMPKENPTIRRKKENKDIFFRLLNFFGLLLSIVFFVLSYFVFGNKHI